jgi:hypothetical protein
MRFDSSKAWNEAVGWIGANLNVLLTLGGIFLLIPALGMNWFTTDLQLAMQQAATTAKPGEMPTEMFRLLGQLFVIFFFIGIFQSIGTMAMLVLYSDQARPTVGEALARAVRCLPTSIGATLLLFLAGMVVGIPVILVIGLFAGLLGMLTGPVAVAVLVPILVLAVLLLFVARLVALSPAIVIDGKLSPMAAIGRSWNLTNGHTLPLAFFLFLLGLAYMVIFLAAQALMGLVLGVGVMSDAVQLAKAGTGAQIAIGSVLGIIGAVASLVWTGVTGAIHSQLSGTGAEKLSDTFQ